MKLVLSGLSKIEENNGLKAILYINAGQSIAECSNAGQMYMHSASQKYCQSAILQNANTFDLHYAIIGLESLFWSSFEWPILRQVYCISLPYTLVFLTNVLFLKLPVNAAY